MWHTFFVDGYWCQAKVYRGGSIFGINGSCVSKLAICNGAEWNADRCIYNYDRGLDFDSAPKGLVEKVVKYCEDNFQDGDDWRWSLKQPDWHVVFYRLVRRKYGYNPPSPEDNIAFGLKAVQIWKRYKRMIKKFGGRGYTLGLTTYQQNGGKPK